MKFLAPLLLVYLLGLPAAAQRIVLRGQVVEAATGEPVPFASVFVPHTSTGTTADLEGRFKMAVSGAPDSVAASSLGFLTARRKLTDAPEQTVLLRLKKGGGVALTEVMVHPSENPAFRILREVQRHKPQNERSALTAAEYDAYNRIEVSLAELPPSLAKRKVVRDIRALAVRQGAAAAADPDAPLPLFASEVGSRVYQRYGPLRRREDLLHKQMRGAGPREGSILSQMLGSNFQNFDFYPNWQSILGKDFISPIAEGGRLTYIYELVDSVRVGQDWCYKITVAPKRSHDLAFQGTVWITMESYALRRVDLAANPDANINFVSDLRIFQDLTPPADGPGLAARTKLVISVRPSEKQAAMRVRFTTVATNVVRNQPHEASFYNVPIVSSIMEPAADGGSGGLGLISGQAKAGDGYFDQHRPDTLSLSEQQTFAVLDSARELPSVRSTLDWIDLFVNGYKRVGNWELGPIINAYAHNTFEGNRFRVGFRTTPGISRDWLTQAYLAYGTLDGRFKYGLRTSYISERRHWTVFSAEHKHDVEQFALLDNDFLPDNNLFVAASRWGPFRQGGPIARDLSLVSAQRDLFHGFTQSLTLRYQDIHPQFALRPRHPSPRPAPPSDTDPSDLHLTELVVESRYAPDENLVQSENRRRAIGLKKLPVFTLRYTMGTVDWFRGNYVYHKFNLLVTHSLSAGHLGRLNYRVEGSYIPTAVPYPVLRAPLGNQTLFFNVNAFNVMNYLEFITDRSVTLRLDHHFEGALLNALPGVRALNWRLVATANVLYGTLSDRNRSGFELPAPGHRPYVEAGYGIENIFRFLRVDFIHRITYRESPGATNFGIRLGAQFRL